MALQLGYGNFLFFKFQDANFTPNVAPSAILLHASKVRADDNIVDSLKKETKTVVLSGGDSVVMTQPNEESSQLTVTILNPVDDDILDLAFVDSVKTVNGPKEKREFFDRIGIELSSFENSLKMVFRPTDAQGNEKLPKEWITFPRAVIVPTQESERGKDEAVTELNILSIGGSTPGAAATADTNIDLTGGIDLSVGLPKAVKITVDSSVFDNVNFGTGAATTRTDIINTFNTAVGKIVATELAGGAGEEFMRLTAFLNSSEFGSLRVEAPSDLVNFLDGRAVIFDSGADIIEVASDPVQLAVRINGDETA